MPSEFDVAVLGAGSAGCAAALAAAASGASVCIVTGPPGATALFSGAWRGVCPADFRRELERADYGLQTVSSGLPHPAGTLVECGFAAASHTAADLGDGTLVVDVAGLPGFDAAALALQWSAASGAQLTAATIVLAQTPPAGWAPVSLAAAIERNPLLLSAPLSEALARRRPRGVILPAVLGVLEAASVHRRVRDEAGLPLAEALGVPPSLPGWRLQHALRQSLAHARVTVLEARAAGAALDRRRVLSVTLTSGETIRAASYVLATGKFLAGGIEANGSFVEPVFDCPVWVDHLDARFAAVEPLLLTDPDRTEDQPLLRAGVHADAEHRPIDAVGDVVFENVLVAGSIRAGWSSASHAIGDAASDGWAAGLKAVRR